MSGWWVVGSVGEAAFFGALFLLGIVSFTTVVTWQVFWPDDTAFKPGLGFWLMVIASVSFMVIGISAFILQVSSTLASPEMRSAMARKVKEDHRRRSAGGGEIPEDSNLPELQPLMDSPGVKLAYRLAAQRGERTPLVLSTLFATTWNAMVAAYFAVTLQQFLSGGPVLFMAVLLVAFLVVSVISTRWFFRLFLQRLGIGPTAVEIDILPMLPGGDYRLYLCQYGRVSFQRLDLCLVAYEEATYEQGTDVRTESRETIRVPVQVRRQLFGAGGGDSEEQRQSEDRENQRLQNAVERSSRSAPSDFSADEDNQECRGSSRENSLGSENPSLGEKSDETQGSGKMRLVAEPEKPLELDCFVSLPTDIMHSFHSPHNAVTWKVVVEGECAKWPAFCRKFPVAVYPRSAV
jgi:hypothetical protein